ncbi:hypothetical protein AAH979_17650 [Plantactinospora sp. ZYX-F-223]|uniref:hypothetical protein n=1 Tax=Plantactinospora sp. ZYX-F-223 TaxID=3144103 RepID=UPI0031FBECE7
MADHNMLGWSDPARYPDRHHGAERHPYDPAVIEMPSPVAFLGLPLWLGPPVLLIIMVTRYAWYASHTESGWSPL